MAVNMNDIPLTENQISDEINHDDIEIIDEIGSGSFGIVFKAKWKDNVVAVKKLSLLADMKFFENEVYHLKRVSHANIVQFHGASTRKPNICLIMEYAEEGSLNGVLYGEPKIAYKASHALNWARQCAEGVAYLHAMQPKPNIHRDLKPGNLLLFDQSYICIQQVKVTQRSNIIATNE